MLSVGNEDTVKNTSMNQKYFIHMNLTNFCRPAVNAKPNIFEKHLADICSPLNKASFATIWVEIDR